MLKLSSSLRPSISRACSKQEIISNYGLYFLLSEKLTEKASKLKELMKNKIYLDIYTVYTDTKTATNQQFILHERSRDYLLEWVKCTCCNQMTSHFIQKRNFCS
jgi:hypothetical protein